MFFCFSFFFVGGGGGVKCVCVCVCVCVGGWVRACYRMILYQNLIYTAEKCSKMPVAATIGSLSKLKFL